MAATDIPAIPTPRGLTTSVGSSADGAWSVLVSRADTEPFNLVASAIFILAIMHTFLAPMFLHWSHVLEERRRSRCKFPLDATERDEDGPQVEVRFAGQMFHFFQGD